MSWTKLPFGRYKGLTLPQVLLTDPDWFFWMEPKLYGDLGDEAAELGRKARRIEICKPDPENWEIEYQYRDDNRFRRFYILPAATEDTHIGQGCIRSEWLNLSCSRRRHYDKGGGKNLIRDFKRYYFTEDRYLTKALCEQFFEDEANFVEL